MEEDFTTFFFNHNFFWKTMELKVSFFHAALFMMMSKKAALEWNINQLVNQQAATLHSGQGSLHTIAYYCRRGASTARAACTLK